MIRVLLLLAGAVIVSAWFGGRARAGDWPQLQNGPDRPGYSPEQLALPLTKAWSVSFVPERIYPTNQPIVYQGRAFIGTESGNFYALDSQTGAKKWTVSDAGPILGTAVAADGRVFFPSMDSNVYAVSAEDGRELWTFRSELDTGFSAALALADGRLYAVNRGGAVFALDPATGEQMWRCDVGVPLLQSPAVRPAAEGKPGRLFVGGNDLCVYAIDTADGARAWKSERLYGQAFKDYWPVVVGDRVIVRSMIADLKPAISNRTRRYSPENFPLTWADPLPDPAWYRNPDERKVALDQGRWYIEHSDAVAAGEIPEEVNTAQDRLAAHYREHPEGKDLFVLDAQTGAEAEVLPHWCAQTMNGPASPPCLDKDGMLVVPMMYINGRWGRMDLSKKRIIDILYDGRNYEGQKLTEITTVGWTPVAGGGNTDENMIVTAAGDLIFSFHCQEANANYTGVWDMKNRRWHNMLQPIPANGPYVTNTQGGGASGAVAADGMLYHMSFHTINAWKSAGARGEGQ